MTIEEIWEAIEKGKTVHWSNSRYHVAPVPVFYSYSEDYIRAQESHISFKDKQVLVVRCDDFEKTGFQSRIEETELNDCFMTD